jgi:glc operon protein GlcG
VKSTIDFATAQKMAVAARAAAAAAGANVAIAVVDSNGDLVYFERMDGSGAVAASQGKARAAMLFGLPTKQVADAMAAGKSLPVTVTKPPQGAQELLILQGGLPVVKDGKVVAAIGVGGSSSANDEKFAQAGIDALDK